MADPVNQTEDSIERPAGHRTKVIVFVCALGLLVLATMFVAVNNTQKKIETDEPEQTEVEVANAENAALRETKTTSLAGLFKGKGLIPPTTRQDLKVEEQEPTPTVEKTPLEKYTDIDNYKVSENLQSQEDQAEQERIAYLNDALRDDIGTNSTGMASKGQSRRAPAARGGAAAANSTSERLRALRARRDRLTSGQSAFGTSIAPPSAVPSASFASAPNAPQGATELASEGLSGPGFEDAGQDPDGMLITPTTVIDAVLNQAVNTDLGGQCVGLVRHNVYNLERTHILIPQGSEIQCVVKNFTGANQAIQNRVALGVASIIKPNGDTINLDVDALDHDGTGGIVGDTDLHIFAQVMGTIGYALIGGLPQYAIDGDTESTSDSAAADAYANLSEQFQPVASKYLNLVPTRTLDRGTAFKVVVGKPLKVKPYKALASYKFGRL